MVRTIPFKPEKAEGIDQDNLNQLRMLRRYFNSVYMGKTVTLKRSPSGKGYHIHAKEGFTLHEAMMLGDCKGRLYYWMIQGYSLTFNAQLNWWGRVTGREEVENVLAKPFWSRLVRRRSRRRRWKHG